MILAGQFDELRAGDVRGDVAPFFDVRVQIARPVEDKSGHANGRQDVAHVYQSIHPRERQRRAGAGAPPLIAGPPRAEMLVVRHARREVFDADGATPLVLDGVVELLPLLWGRGPWVIRR